jgi:hypothetical protein
MFFYVIVSAFAIYVSSIEGCNAVETVEQKDFVAQDGTVNPRTASLAAPSTSSMLFVFGL